MADGGAGLAAAGEDGLRGEQLDQRDEEHLTECLGERIPDTKYLKDEDLKWLFSEVWGRWRVLFEWYFLKHVAE